MIVACRITRVLRLSSSQSKRRLARFLAAAKMSTLGVSAGFSLALSVLGEGVGLGVFFSGFAGLAARVRCGLERGERAGVV